MRVKGRLASNLRLRMEFLRTTGSPFPTMPTQGEKKSCIKSRNPPESRIQRALLCNTSYKALRSLFLATCLFAALPKQNAYIDCSVQNNDSHKADQNH